MCSSAKETSSGPAEHGNEPSSEDSRTTWRFAARSRRRALLFEQRVFLRKRRNRSAGMDKRSIASPGPGSPGRWKGQERKASSQAATRSELTSACQAFGTRMVIVRRIACPIRAHFEDLEHFEAFGDFVESVTCVRTTRRSLPTPPASTNFLQLTSHSNTRPKRSVAGAHSRVLAFA
jgi:hypothetical protein